MNNANNTDDTKTTIATLEQRLEFAGMPAPDAVALAKNPSARAAGLLVGAECAHGASLQLAEGETLRPLTDNDFLAEGDGDYLQLVMIALDLDPHDPEGWRGFTDGWNSVAGK